MKDAAKPGRRSATESGRRAAYETVAHVLADRAHVGDELAEWRSSGALPPREVALAMELALGALRHFVTLGHVLSAVGRVDERRTAPALKAILWVGAYQLIWMDRIPAYAAVDDAVAAARARIGAGASRLVNAVLRNLLRAVQAPRTAWERGNRRHVRVSWDRACAFKMPVAPGPERAGDELRHVAAAAGARLSHLRRLAEQFGAEAAEEVAWASQAPPATVLHRNALRIDEAEFARRVFEELGPSVELADDVAFAPAGTALPQSELLRDGLAYVQDTAAHAAATLLAARPHERVLDLCAAPGGKTITLALAMDDRGEIVAADSSAARLAMLARNVARLGLTCVRTRLVSPEDATRVLNAVANETSPGAIADSARTGVDPARSGDRRRTRVNRARTGEPVGTVDDAGFDAVLLDAPCTNTGVLARRPEARLTFTARKLEALAALQRRLLRQAAAQVRAGGRLVYSTCSLEHAENEQQIVAFLGEQPAWRLGREHTTLPRWGPHAADWRDGGYAALLRRE